MEIDDERADLLAGGLGVASEVPEAAPEAREDDAPQPSLDLGADGVVEPPRRGVLSSLWQRLTSPTDRKPSDFGNHRIARILNAALDGPTPGAAAEAELGESVSLAVDAAMEGRGGAQTPLGHVAGSALHYGWLRLNARLLPPQPPAQPEPPGGEGEKA